MLLGLRYLPGWAWQAFSPANGTKYKHCSIITNNIYFSFSDGSAIFSKFLVWLFQNSWKTCQNTWKTWGKTQKNLRPSAAEDFFSIFQDLWLPPKIPGTTPSYLYNSLFNSYRNLDAILWFLSSGLELLRLGYVCLAVGQKNVKNCQQAGAELSQAQLKLGLYFNFLLILVFLDLF